MIVLHEAVRQPGRGLEDLLVEAFVKHAARVTEDLWFKEHHVVEGQPRGVHREFGSRGRCIRPSLR